MSILELEYHDTARNWHLNKTTFGPVNLLVGNSGVGKTQILRAIDSIKSATTEGTDKVRGCSWNVRIQVGTDEYLWSVKLADGSLKTGNVVIDESIERNDEAVVERSAESILFHRKSVAPRLRDTELAVSLFRDEDSVAPLYKSVSRVVWSYSSTASIVTYLDFIERINPPTAYLTIDALRDDVDEDILERALRLQIDFPAEFQTVVRDYKDIFSNVTDVKIGRHSEFAKSPLEYPQGYGTMLTMGIKEQSVNRWVYGRQVSSGMWRTFIQLLEMELSPSGTAFLVDEVENSLGVNCLGPVIDRVKQRSRHLQFIMTSHHPYIINNIGIDDWRIVTRAGSTVTVKNASDVAALQGKSAQEKFVRLINAPEFEEGIQ